MRTTAEHRARIARVEAALDLCEADQRQAIAMPHGSDRENAGRAVLIALTCARKAAWWRVLHRITVADPDVHRLYRLAVLAAAAEERDNARFWREMAADWAARAEHRPTSDAAGALSNWDELGVTA